MTTLQKVWLGFGTLTALLVLSSVAIIIRVRSIEGQVGEIANARNRSATVRQLEINTLGYALNVRAYLQTGEPQARQDAVDAIANVERQLKEYERLATIDRQRGISARFAPLWAELKKLAQALLDAENRQANPEDLKKLYVFRTDLEKLLDDEMQVEATETYNARRDSAKQDVHAIVGFAMILLIVGVCLAVVTSGTVGRAIVSGERAVAEQAERLRMTLASIGDGVIATDTEGRITELNPVAESLTGWTTAEASGQPVDTVFRIVNHDTRQPVENQLTRALKAGVIVGLANHTILIAKDGTEWFIDDSAAPIRNKVGEIVGGVLIFRDITLSKRANDALRLRETFISGVLGSITDAFFTVDKDWRIEFVNDEIVKRLGKPREQFIGANIWELFPEAVGGEAHTQLHRAMAERVSVEYDVCYERWQRWFNDRASPTVDGGLSVYSRDITERKKFDDALRASHARFETLFDTSPVGMYLVDMDFRLRSMNAQTRATFGDIQELIHRDFGEVVHILWPPQVADDILARFRHTLATGESYKSAELSEVRYDRNVREYYEWQVHRIALPDRQYGVVCYFIDISVRVLTEQALRDSEVRYRRLFQTAKDGILILNAHTGKITDANAFMSGLVGIEAHAMVGLELHEIGLFGDTEASKQAFRTLQENKYIRYEHLPVQNQNVAGGGGTVEVEVIANVYQEDHALVAQCNVRDISQRVVMEKKLVTLAEQLAGESRRKDEFLATLAHELRNPLAPVRNAVEVLRMKAPNFPELRWATEIIDRQTQGMARLIDDLMDISRINQGKMELRREPVELSKIVQVAVETSRPLIENMGHELTVTLPPGPVIVDADLTRLAQVFLNLLNNAAKYTERGGRIEFVASVECRLASGEPANPFSLATRNCTLDTPFVVVSVKDTGIGIPADKLPTIFEMFSQVEGALSRSQGGLGIGLCLVKRLVEMHGGSVEARSGGLGQGSEFLVRLPIVVEQTYPRQASDDGDKAQPTSDLRILVVDDNRDAAESLAMLLKMMGNNIHTAHDGEEAVTAAREFRPHVVLCDIGLPKLNGYEACCQMKAQAWNKKMILIAVTGWGQDGDRQKSEEAGFDHHLIKPVDPQSLMKLLAELESVKA